MSNSKCLRPSYDIEPIAEIEGAAQALLVCRNSSEKVLQNILTCTKGIIFLGTPQGASSLVKWAMGVAKYTNRLKTYLHSNIRDLFNSDLKVLARMQIDFGIMAKARANMEDSPITITCFYETSPLPGIGEVSALIEYLHFTALIMFIF